MVILITGCAGFLGSHLAKKLIELGHTIIGIDDLSTGNILNLESIYKKITFYEHHLDNGESTINLLALIFKTNKIDVVYHCAATVGVQNVINSPTTTIKNNLEATEAIVTICSYFIPQLIHLSTSECYGKNENLLSENSDVTYGPSIYCRWSYSMSKALDEMIILESVKKYHYNATILRLFNCSGSGQSPNYGMVIPRFIQQALRNEPLTIFGDGTQLRNFTHVTDTVSILCALIDPVRRQRSSGLVINCGNNQEVSISELAYQVIESTLSRSRPEFHWEKRIYPEGSGFEDMKRRIPDLSRLEQVLGYKPEFRSYKEIIKDIIKWDGPKLEHM